MPAIIVSDTSCLILLDKIDELNLLQKLFGTVVITEIVSQEFGDAIPDWINVEKTVAHSSQLLLQTGLDKGEASSIALALEHPDSLLIIDELKGRKLAKKLGLTITGTLGILAQAKMKGHISSLKLLVEKIKKTNFRLDEQLVRQTLIDAGEG